MSNPVISGDGIFSHVFVGAADLQKSTAFYDAALGALGIKNLGPFGNGWVLFGRENRLSSSLVRAMVKRLPATA